MIGGDLLQTIIDDETNDTFKRIHSTFMKDKTGVQNVHTTLKDPRVKEIVYTVLKMINDYDTSITLDATQGIVEFWRYSCDGKKPVKTPLALHQDDYGITKYKVYTVIFYIQKDDTIDGGNLIYIDDSKKRIEIPTHTNKAIIMSGDTWHVPTSCSGSGLRDAIVVQIKRLTK
jgi:hypothetical protein